MAKPIGTAIDFEIQIYISPLGDDVDFILLGYVDVTEIVAIPADIIIGAPLGSAEIFFPGVEADSIPADITIEALTGGSVGTWSLDDYAVAVMAAERKWSARVEIDFTEGTLNFNSDDIISFHLLKEASSDSGNPLGFITSNEFTMSLDNSDRKFTPSNPAKTHNIKPGLEVRPYLILEVGGVDAEIALGKFYTSDWDTDSNSIEAVTTCHDRLMNVINLDTPQIPVMIDTTVVLMFGRLFRAIGLDVDEYDISPSLQQKIKAGWWQRDVIGASLQVLAEAGNCYVSVTADDRITVRPNYRTADAAVEYTDEDMIFSINNPQRINEIFTAIKMQYRIPYQKEINDNLVRADNIIIPAGGVTLDRIDFQSSDHPALQVNFAHIYGLEQATERAELYLGGATAGTFTLGDGTTDTAAIAFDALAATIQTELEVIYGAANVVVTGSAGSFLIDFVAAVGASGIEGDFGLLTGASFPYVRATRPFIGPVVSEIERMWFGATDIILKVNNTGAEETVNIQVRGIGSGHHLGHSVVTDAPAVIEYGHKELSLENHLIQSQAVSQDYCERLVTYLSDPLSQFSVEYRGDPVREIGDIISIESATNKIEQTDIMIKRLELSFDGGLSGRIWGRKI